LLHFQRLLIENGAKVVLFHEFPDHHLYSQAEFREFEQAALKAGAEAILTTAKDAVKFVSDDFHMPLGIVDVELVIEEKAQFNSWILTNLPGAGAAVPAKES
jgi:tetraacyldisaccharide-1-P 4'-kinase